MVSLKPWVCRPLAFPRSGVCRPPISWAEAPHEVGCEWSRLGSARSPSQAEVAAVPHDELFGNGLCQNVGWVARANNLGEDNVPLPDPLLDPQLASGQVAELDDSSASA